MELKLIKFGTWILSFGALVVAVSSPIKNGVGFGRRRDLSTFLGCFVTWANIDQLIQENAKTSTPEVKFCEQPPYWNQKALLHPVLLRRGDLCVYSNWSAILNKLPDLTQVQLELCDLECHSGGRGHCGGNFYFSMFSVQLQLTNMLEPLQVENCSVPPQIPLNMNYSLPESSAVSYSNLDFRCVTRPSDLHHNFKTYLPNNSPAACIRYCRAATVMSGGTLDLDDITVVVIQSLDSLHFNCFCINSLISQLLWNSRVSEHYCFSKNVEQYISLYSMVSLVAPTTWIRDRDISPLSSNSSSDFEVTVILDIDEDLHNGWFIGPNCAYFNNSEELNQPNSCQVNIEEKYDAGIGFWSTCPIGGQCSLNYSSTAFWLRSINISYYAEVASQPQYSIVVNYRGPSLDWQPAASKLLNESGWGFYIIPELTLPANPEISIHVSVKDSSTTLDFVIIDKVMLTMEDEETFCTSKENDTFRLILESEEDMFRTGWINDSCCSYKQNYADFNCTVEPGPNDSQGFWSNCGNPSCVLVHEVSPTKIPTELELSGYIRRNDSCPTGITVLVHYRNGSVNPSVNFSINETGWIYNESVILNNLAAGDTITVFLQSTNICTCVMVDRIILTGIELDERTCEPTNPVDPEVQLVLDTKTDLNSELWSADGYCIYQENYNLFDFDIDFPQGDECHTGFWSNCHPLHHCILRHTVAANQIPFELELSGYIGQNDSSECPTGIIVQYTSQSKVFDVPVSGTNWFISNPGNFPDLTSGDIISIEFMSISNCSFVMVDKIVLNLKPNSEGDSSSTVPPLETDPTTSVPYPTIRDSYTTTRDPFTTQEPLICKSEDMCNSIDHRGLVWSSCPGETDHQDCPGNDPEKATWKCLDSGYFDPAGPNYSKCSSGWYNEIEQSVKDAESLSLEVADRYLTEMKEQTANTETGFYGHEIDDILHLGEDILDKVDRHAQISDIEDLAETAVAICRNVLVNPTPWEDIDDIAETGMELIHSVEMTTFELTSRVILQEQGKNYEKTFDTFSEVKATAASTEKFSGILVYPTNPDTVRASIEISDNWASHFPDQDFVDFVGSSIISNYANHLFLTKGDTVTPSASHSVLNGDLISFSFGNGNGTEVSPGKPFYFNDGSAVRIKFKHDIAGWGSEVKTIRRKLHVSSGETPKVALGPNPCVYWDAVETMSWSTAGCSVIEQEESQTICECSHLSSFSILMNTHNYVGKDENLELLTWILSSLSIICLIMCIIVYATPCVAAIRGPRCVVTINLCICLLVGNILMLGFVDKNYLHLSPGFCTTFGIMAHFSFLSAFCWMGFEGYVLYKVLIVVFDDGNDRFAMQYIVAYGSSGAIVLTTVLTAVVLKHDAYESDLYCWLSGRYIWAFMGPVALILVGNTVMLVISMRKAIMLSKNLPPKARRHTKPFLKWIKGCATLMCLLGTTWAVGYFMLIDSTVVSNIAAYVFTVLNALQGVFLFIFHICLNKRVRDVIKKYLPVEILSSIKRTISGKTTREELESNVSVKHVDWEQLRIYTLQDSALTFGSAYDRRKAQIGRHFQTTPKDLKDGIMPESDATSSRKANARIKPPKSS